MSEQSNLSRTTQTPFAALRRFVRQPAQLESCELCSAPVEAEHDHLVEPKTRKIVCACYACGLLFTGQNGTKYKRVPRQARYLSDFELTDAQWDDLLIPIGMAFFFFSSAADKMIALYPSPAGPTESLLTLDAWQAIADENPILKQMEPDVEALLVNRIGETREYYIAPIDACYRLVGLIRMNWRGLSGGVDVWREIQNFFSALKRHSR